MTGKALRIIACLFLIAATPITPGVSDPEYGCDLNKGYCVVKLEELRELMQSQKKRCSFYGA